MAGKPIRLTPHCSKRLAKRGGTLAEVETAIRTQKWKPAEQGRLTCEFVGARNVRWEGKMYARRKVKPFFEDGPLEIVVVTVLVYYY